MDERFQRDGTLRLVLIGELDVAVVDHLSLRPPGARAVLWPDER